MSRKDYELIARVLRETRTGKTEMGNGPRAKAYWQDRRDVIEAFASTLAATNPRFDRTQFLAACATR